jgi:hypothetical protein
MVAKSLLYADDQVLTQPTDCSPCRQEVTTKIKYKGNIYTLIMRDKVVIEDPYLVLVKAYAYAVRTNTAYQGRIVPRAIRDFLIKSSVQA